MKKKQSSDWEYYFKSRGISESLIDVYLCYIDGLKKNNVPVIFEFEHLSRLFGLKTKILAAIVNKPESFYRKFSIPKKRGGVRAIVSPYPSLLFCQKWIYKNILLSKKPHNAVHGFVPGRSIFTNASLHLNKKALLKMDLKDFFPSIPINWVVNLFSSFGYANNVSYYLSKICCYEDKLCQGSATSPYITNLLLLSLDNRLSLLSNKYNLSYTRYADDLTFSGDYIPCQYIDIVSSIIENYGLCVNSDKTCLHTKQGKRIVTGLSVSGSNIKVPRKYKRDLRSEIYSIIKFGLLSHISKRKIRNPMYLDSLIGRINFLIQAEPDNAHAKESLKLITDIKTATSV